MTKAGIIGISVLAFFITSCSSPKQESNTTEKSSDTVTITSNNIKEFEEQFLMFYNALKNKDAKTLNRFVEPEHGFLVIYSEGAMPEVSSTNDLVNFTTYAGTGLYDLITFPEISLKKETLPKINCDSKSFYDKEGAFYSEENIFPKQEMWNYGDFNRTEKEAFKSIASSFTHNILITGHGRYGVIFKDGKLTVSFMDYRKPCNA